MKIKTDSHNLLLIVVTAVLFLTIPGSGGVKAIPEVSNALYDEIMGGPLYTNTAGAIIAEGANLVFITFEGKIYRFNLEKHFLDFLVDLNTPIEPGIIHQQDMVLLQEKNTAHFILFDLKNMQIIETSRLNVEKIISLDTENKIIGYITGQRLVFSNYADGQTLAEANIDTGSASIKIKKETTKKNKKKIQKDLNEKADNQSKNNNDIIFFNSFDMTGDGASKLLVLSAQTLYIFNKKQKDIEAVQLESKASSGFLFDNGSIYYGSENRELVKFSLATRKNEWRFKLADRLKIAPQKAGTYIVITPEDHNIYFFNKRGTLYWWEKLDSTRLLPPVIMKENVAVFLWNKTIKYFNFKQKSTYTYPLDRVVFSNALYIDDYLYVIAETGEQNLELPLKGITKIGNNFGVVIQTDPQNIIPMGRSIKFKLEAFNLIKPELKLNILDTENKHIFEKIINSKDDPSFIWIPNRATTYRLVVEINAENRKSFLIEHSFDVIDVENLLLQYYYQLQKSSYEEPVICYPGFRQDVLKQTEPTKIKKNEKAAGIPGRKKN
ncbi:MAG: PQQ-like beta-propeller repeat protein [Acidobacteria bacterium]|nr:PQQ-like beta-propeller repeat protein [Acidobacteriota bacterium]